MILKVIDLFCGAGGSTLGYKMAGFDVILAVDINEVFLSTYQANHPEVETMQIDITQLTAKDLPKADVILGSTPCQNFSIANIKRTYDMSLTNHFLSLIYEYNPKYWMLENVPGIAPYLHGVNYNILHAADYGVTTITNLTISCYDCNMAKGTKTASEFGFPEVAEKAIRIGRSTKITGRDGEFLNLHILALLRSGKNPAQISKILPMPKSALQYHLDQLKHGGFVRKIGYGTWGVSKNKLYLPEVQESRLRVTIDNPSQSNLYAFTHDSIRAHAFMFTLKVPDGLRNWNNETRRAFLQKSNINFTSLTVFGGGQRIQYKGRKIWLTNKSVIIYEKSSYLADTATDAKSHAIYNFISLVKGLERLLHADFTEHAGRQYSFKVSRQHYALIKNALAKQYGAEDKKLNIYSDKGLWFVIDNSFNLHEAETVHPETADTDSTKVQNFFNSLKEQPLTTGFILKVMDGIQQNQLVFAQNMGSHIKVIKDLGNGVNELASMIEKLKQGHSELSKGQRTLESLEEE